MVTAIPTVKPSSTGQGTNWIDAPEAGRGPSEDDHPGDDGDRRNGPVPSWATIGASTTAMAPVGPETCTDDPPKTAATMPATMAVMIPAVGSDPRRDPESESQRKCDDTDRQPGQEVDPPGPVRRPA